jgi:hypothetical protein
LCMGVRRHYPWRGKPGIFLRQGADNLRGLCMGVRRHYPWRGKPGIFLHQGADNLRSCVCSWLAAPHRLARQNCGAVLSGATWCGATWAGAATTVAAPSAAGFATRNVGKFRSLAAAPARVARQGCSASHSGAAGLQRQREWRSTSVCNARRRIPGQNLSPNFLKIRSNVCSPK